MEEKSLRVYSDKKFFTKLTNTITKLLIPTKIGINGMLISIKRNNVLKSYENYINSENVEADKKDEVEKKYEDMFSLYLEAIDKHMMDNVYKKVKNDTATGFEREALSKYYMVIHLKDTEYLEYKYRKQIFLIQLDYDTVKELNKLSQNPEEVAKYEEREWSIMRYNVEMDTNRELGKEQGRKEGRKEGRKIGIEEGKRDKEIEIVKKLNSLNTPIEKIAEIVGLSTEEVKKIIG